MASASEAVAKAASYIGLNGKMFTSHYGWPDNTPWCALFQSYVKDEIDPSLWESSAAVSGIVGQLKRVEDWEAQAGDLVAFNWDGRSDLGWMDHIGMVEWSGIDANKNGYFGTIEGNYGGSNTTSKVTRVTRNNQGNYFTAFFRPNYDGKGEEIMYTLDEIGQAVWEWHYSNQPTPFYQLYYNTVPQLAELQTQCTAMAAAIEALAGSMGVDPEEVGKIVADAVAAKLEGLEIKLDVV